MPTVFVIDDALEVRRALTRLLTSARYDVRSFDSAECFLEAEEADTVGCLLLDVSLPGLSGLDLQRMLSGSMRDRPVVFLTGCENLQASVQAMKAGAIDFLIRPTDDQRLFAAINQALQRDYEERRRRRMRRMVEQRLATLTRRERQVLKHVVLGRLNKQTAADLGTTEKTVKFQRACMMRKMRARSVPELVWLAALVGIALDSTLCALSWPPTVSARSNRTLAPIDTRTARYA